MMNDPFSSGKALDFIKSRTAINSEEALDWQQSN